MAVGRLGDLGQLGVAALNKGGGVVRATGTLIENYESLSGFAANSPSQSAIALTTKGALLGSNALQQDSLNGVAGASGEAAAYKGGEFNVVTNPTDDIGLYVSRFTIDADSEGQVSQYGTQFGKSAGAVQGALATAPVAFGGAWAAVHTSENASLVALTPGSFGVRPTVRSGALPYGGKISVDATYIKVDGVKPAIILVLDDCMAVQDAHIQAILDRGLVATRAIPSSYVGSSGSYSSLATLLTQQAAGIALIPNATRNDQPVNTFGNRAAALAEMDASKAACAAMGFKASGLDYSVWPNGYFRETPTFKQVAAMTGNGTTSGTFGAAVTWVAGERVVGPGVPRETTVVSVAGDGLSAVLSNPIPTQTQPAAARNITGEYAGDKLIQDVKASGKWKMIRTTLPGPFWPWFGPGDGLDFLHAPGDSWTSANFAQCKTSIDRAVVRKSVIMPYWHGDWASGEMLQVLDYIATLKAAGAIDVLTMPQLGQRTLNAQPPA